MSKDLKTIFSLGRLRHFSMDNRYLFAVILAIVFVMEVFVVRDAVYVILSLENQKDSKEVNAKGVRVNFADYQKDIDHIRGAGTFVPNNQIDKNPFGNP